MKTKLPTEWQELSDQLGFQDFTPIQTQLFEPITEGENILGVSPTGTGKTLAYLLPSLLKLQKKKAQHGSLTYRLTLLLYSSLERLSIKRAIFILFW